MYNINWKIQFEAQATKKVYELGLLLSCEIIHDEEQLSDTAKITLPTSVLNEIIKIEQNLRVGDRVAVWLGYEEDPKKLKKEFSGFIKGMNVDQFKDKDSTLNIECEDEIFAFRKPVKNIIKTETDLKEIVEGVIAELKLDLTLETNVNCTYPKFEIKGSGYDVLKKIQEDTKYDVYIKDKVLFISAQYLHKNGEAIYDFAKNIEKGELTYEASNKKNVEVVVKHTDKTGKVLKYTTGRPGGEVIEKEVPTPDEKAMKQLAEQYLFKAVNGTYKGSITGWLVPYIETGYTAKIIDDDYPLKTGSYYVKKTTTTISENGGVRKIDLGIKLSKPTGPE